MPLTLARHFLFTTSISLLILFIETDQIVIYTLRYLAKKIEILMFYITIIIYFDLYRNKAIAL